MFRSALTVLSAVVLVSASLIPDEADARRGGGGGFRGGGGGFHGGGGMRAGGFHGGAGRFHGGGFAGRAHPSHPIAGRPIAGRPGRPIAGRPGRPIAGYPGYRPGWGYGAAAAGAAALGAYGAYGYYGNSGCGYDSNGNYVCPNQYPY